MLKRAIKESCQNKLKILLCLLAATSFFHGSGCEDCSCEGDSIYIVFYVDNEPAPYISIVEGGQETVRVALFEKGQPKSAEIWEIVDTPSTDIIKPDGCSLSATSGPTTLLSLAAQNPFTGTGGVRPYGDISSFVRIKATDTKGTYVVKQDFLIIGFLPRVRTSGPYSADAAWGCIYEQGAERKRDWCMCDLGLSQTYQDASMNVFVQGASPDTSYTFSATVPPSKRKFVTVTGIEQVDPLSAKINLRFLRTQDLVGRQDPLIFPLYMKAIGSNSRVIFGTTDIWLVQDD